MLNADFAKGLEAPSFSRAKSEAEKSMICGKEQLLRAATAGRICADACCAFKMMRDMRRVLIDNELCRERVWE